MKKISFLISESTILCDGSQAAVICPCGTSSMKMEYETLAECYWQDKP
jgi:hypothetical protein